MLSSLKITLLPLFSLLTFIPIQQGCSRRPGPSAGCHKRYPMASPQVQIKFFSRSLCNILWQIEFISTHFTIFYFLIFFVTPLSPSTVKIMSGIETQSRSYRFVLNLWTLPLRFPYWCHCELRVPRLVVALPRLLFRHCLPL